MACGVPIITSDGIHMSDIVDDKMSIRIDATNVQSIKDAIYTIQINNEKRLSMGIEARKKSMDFDINNRAKRITKFMNLVLKN